MNVNIKLDKIDLVGSEKSNGSTLFISRGSCSGLVFQLCVHIFLFLFGRSSHPKQRVVGDGLHLYHLISQSFRPAPCGSLKYMEG